MREIYMWERDSHLTSAIIFHSIVPVLIISLSHFSLIFLGIIYNFKIHNYF